MRIKSFAVNNFRGITGGLDKNVINFDDSNTIFVFGQNNVGKSSILKAYEAFYEDEVTDKDFNNANGADIEIEVEFVIEETTDKPIIDAASNNKFDNLKNTYLDSNNILKLKKTFKSSDKGKKPDNQTYKPSGLGYETKGYGGVGLHAPFKTMMLQPLYIKAMPSEADVETIVTEVLKEVATSRLKDTERAELKAAEEIIKKLQAEIYKASDIDIYKREVNEKFSHLFNGFEIDIDEGSSKAKFTHDKIGKDFKVRFKTKDETPIFNDYDQMGHGSVRIAIFLLMLMRDKLHGESETKKNFLVLFEEPELFLHPVLTKELRSLIYEVSDRETPFQVLCASHSPQMIDISKDHSSLARMVKEDDGTEIFQVQQEDLKTDDEDTKEKVKQKLHEILRFDPYVCESFYACEVLLVEGDTEAIIARGFQQVFNESRKVYVLNCHSVSNIPFYQKFFSKFKIPYSVICDTDSTKEPLPKGWNNDNENPIFTGGIQKSIYDQFAIDKVTGVSRNFFVFDNTFETPHKALDDPFKYSFPASGGKPFNANAYWKQLISAKTDDNETDFNAVPIVKYLRKIMLKGE